MSEIQGFPAIPYPKLRELILSLPTIDSPIQQKDGVITDHSLFILGHISVLDAAPKNVQPTEQEKQARRTILPWYERLLVYYYLRKELIEA